MASKNWPTYTEAQQIVQAAGIKSSADYNKRYRDLGLPSGPNNTYDGEGWVSWGEFLGTGNVDLRTMIWPSYQQAQQIVQQAGIKGCHPYRKQYRELGLPSAPAQVYSKKGWVSWSEFLGIEIINTQTMVWPSYRQARQIVQQAGIKNAPDYTKQYRDLGLPSKPHKIYEDNGWVSWGEFLGTGSRTPSTTHVGHTYQQAQQIVQQAGIKIWTDYKKRYRDLGLPSNPDKTYRGNGWCGRCDFLGTVGVMGPGRYWNYNAILAFLRDLRQHISELEPRELLAIMRQNGLLSARSSLEQHASLLASIKQLLTDPDPEAAMERISTQLEQDREQDEADQDALDQDEIPIIPVAATPAPQPEPEPELPTMDNSDLHVVDRMGPLLRADDGETVEFLISNRVHKLWRETLNGERDPEQLRAEQGGERFTTIRDRFLTQYDGARTLRIPRGYRFPHRPNLMQRLTAYRVLTDRRIGNFSGTGAGKTVSALLASRVIRARRTLIIAHNSTIRTWKQVIQQTFPQHAHQYQVLNYEKFSQNDQRLQQLLQLQDIDMVVLDEIHLVKQRQANDDSSRRRAAMLRLLAHASQCNPQLAVLGMSATPVINDLQEGKALLELIRGQQYPELATAPTQENANHLHQKLMVYGLRWMPKYTQKLTVTRPTIDGSALLDRLRQAGSVLRIEQTLLDHKLQLVRPQLQPGTILYCHYVDKVATAAYRQLRQQGYSVALYTGQHRVGLQQFLNREREILVASTPVGTGVDGLQQVCNRMIVLSLPWTHAEYEQLLGRIHRQGSQFQTAEIIIPQVLVQYEGQTWSWDQLRWDRVIYKQDLASAAVDGEIFKGTLRHKAVFRIQATQALEAWITRLERGELAQHHRPQLQLLPVSGGSPARLARFGELSQYHKRWNNRRSDTLHRELLEDPADWHDYHELYRRERADWPEVPFQVLAQDRRLADASRVLEVGDFGCGEAGLAELLPQHRFHNFDHVAVGPQVTACNLAAVPLPDESLDRVVLCLALMGKDCARYLAEAYRTLRPDRFLLLAEAAGRFDGQQLEQAVRQAGFEICNQRRSDCGRFVYLTAVK